MWALLAIIGGVWLLLKNKPAALGNTPAAPMLPAWQAQSTKDILFQPLSYGRPANPGFQQLGRPNPFRPRNVLGPISINPNAVAPAAPTATVAAAAVGASYSGISTGARGFVGLNNFGPYGRNY
jgi:hypothetical protein